MRVFLGVILGVILTVAVSYFYDSSTGRAANSLPPTAADGHPPLVNWDVVSQDWQTFQTGVRDTVADLEKKLKRHTG